MINFLPNSDCSYKYNYSSIFQKIESKELPEIPTYRSLILDDLFFIVYFVMGIPIANHPFVVKAARRVETSSLLNKPTLRFWARGHFKTTFATARTIQRILTNPESTHGKFSHTRPIAKGMLRPIKFLFETNELLKQCFPDILYNNPQSEAPKWSEDDGIIVKRKSSKRESTVEAWGLIEGMPVSKHYDYIDYDDVETADVVENPDMIVKLKDKYNVSQNLITKGGQHDVWGTFYSHAGLLVYLKEKKNILNQPIYNLDLVPATDDGLPTGNPVFLSQEELNDLRADEYSFNCQQLLNPTPVGKRKFDSSMLQFISPEKIPSHCLKFQLVDAAGNDKNGQGDAWASFVFGVEPNLDDLGLSNVYVMDGILAPLDEEEAPHLITNQFIKNLPIELIGVEKVGLSTTEIHVSTALASKGFIMTVQNNGIVLLRPSGRAKVDRIKNTLIPPFRRGKIFFSTSLPPSIIERIKLEMDKFPFWHDDFLDVLSYLYDVIKMDSITWVSSYEEENEIEELERLLSLSNSSGRNEVTGY